MASIDAGAPAVAEFQLPGVSDSRAHSVARICALLTTALGTIALLGWVIEALTGRRYADLMSEHVWRPIGAERSAYITVDRLGAPRTAGGMCVATRDLARVGQWMIEHPSPWIDDIERSGERAAWDAGSFVPYFPGMPIHYRSQWYVLHGAAPLIFGVGIHGQNLFIDRRNQIVISRFASQSLPVDPARIALMLRAVSEIRKLLS